MKKKIIILVAFILIVGVAICFLPWKHKINKTLNGVQTMIGNNEYIEEITIAVTGTYNKYLFKDDTFYGAISTNIHGDIWSRDKGKLVFSDNNASMVSLSNDNNGYYFGNLLCSENFSEVLILVCEKSGDGSYGWYGEDGVYIVAPAQNKVQAIETANKLREKSVWLSQSSWE